MPLPSVVYNWVFSINSFQRFASIHLQFAIDYFHRFASIHLKFTIDFFHRFASIHLSFTVDFFPLIDSICLLSSTCYSRFCLKREPSICFHRFCLNNKPTASIYLLQLVASIHLLRSILSQRGKVDLLSSILSQQQINWFHWFCLKEKPSWENNRLKYQSAGSRVLELKTPTNKFHTNPNFQMDRGSKKKLILISCKQESGANKVVFLEHGKDLIVTKMQKPLCWEGAWKTRLCLHRQKIVRF